MIVLVFQMSRKMGTFVSFTCVLLLLSCFCTGLEGRYLPTRSGNTEDRISKLKELLRDLLESEIDDYNGMASLYPRQQP
ncbi:hypothetical protein M8J76_002784 [Diaphorina citri]|nr:hypothetical protein M8J76_002784 [Diaphorina citri]KAI5753875.1 hypothetical protein M8J77_004031 [Diaphorina citri]